VTASHRALTAGPEWHKQALCAAPEYADKNLWFPKQTDHKAIREAKEVCWNCPVIQQCLTWAYTHHEDRGIWGGVTEWERRRVHKRSRPKTGKGAGVIVSRSPKAAA
jgi:WhiB family redox-sensing transcriptional regulator